ncbi:MAG: hypothetical protein ACK5MV_13920 [Aminipila sp.]
MKKTLTALLLIVAVLSLSMTAYAADATTGNMTVSYEYTAPSSGGTGDTSTYTINIPASVTQDNLDAIPITAAKNNIADGKMVVVAVDWDNSYDASGFFNLYKNKGEANQEAICCRVLMYTDSTLSTGKYVDCFPELRGVPIAKFTAGNTSPTYGGYMSLNPLTTGLSVSSGTYTGTLYFNIQVTDAE